MRPGGDSVSLQRRNGVGVELASLQCITVCTV